MEPRKSKENIMSEFQEAISKFVPYYDDQLEFTLKVVLRLTDVRTEHNELDEAIEILRKYGSAEFTDCTQLLPLDPKRL